MGNMTDEQRMVFFTAVQCHGLSRDELKKTVVELLKDNRVNHVLGCADTAVELAKCWGADLSDAYRAGMLHDVTKALPSGLQLELCQKLDVEIDAFSRNNPKVLHAVTGAAVAQRVFGENPAVVRAIRSHTTGCGGMDVLQKIIYIADYIEPNRDFEGVEELRRLAFKDLNAAVRSGLEMSVALLKEQGREVCPDSLEALEKENTVC